MLNDNLFKTLGFTYCLLLISVNFVPADEFVGKLFLQDKSHSVLESSDLDVKPSRPLSEEILHASVPNGQSNVTWLQQVREPLTRRDLPTLAAQSCAAASCHGGPRPGVSSLTAPRGSEFSIWLQHDPHAQSWRTISGEKSVEIMTRLRILRDGEIVDQYGFNNCLACHNTTEHFAVTRSPEPILEGVGCSACHGPSGNWIDNHFQFDQSNHLGLANGFVPNQNLLARARMCASCHIGDSDRDMNHDIIAAGHPVLWYEMSTFHNRQPKHWRDAESSNADRFEPMLWLSGQIASVDASLELLEARATSKLSISRWPEFAAFDCASCHHSIRGAGRQTRGVQLGAARYGDWNQVGLEWLLQWRQSIGAASAEDYVLGEALELIRTTMESTVPPSPEMARAVAVTGKLALDQWLCSAAGNVAVSTFDGGQLCQIVSNTAGRNTSIRSWESSAQLYLASVAARFSWPGGPNGSARPSALHLRTMLQFSPANSLSKYPYDQDTDEDELKRSAVNLATHLGPVVLDQRAKATSVNVSVDELRKAMEQLNKQYQQERNLRAAEQKSSDKGDDLRKELATPPKEKPLDQPKVDPMEKLKKQLEKVEEELKGKGS